MERGSLARAPGSQIVYVSLFSALMERVRRCNPAQLSVPTRAFDVVLFDPKKPQGYRHFEFVLVGVLMERPPRFGMTEPFWMLRGTVDVNGPTLQVQHVGSQSVFTVEDRPFKLVGLEGHQVLILEEIKAPKPARVRRKKSDEDFPEIDE